MSGFHSHDDDFLYEVQRRDRKEPVPSRQTQRSPSMHRQAKAAGQAAMDAIVALAEQAEHAESAKIRADHPPNIAFTLKDAAAHSGVKVCFLRRAIHDEILPAKLAGKRFVILRDDLVRFISALPAATSRRRSAESR